MTETVTPVLRRTPLYDRHCASKGKMVPFGGWEMPVEYSGIATEHMAVRTRAGIFDVSHMGEIEIAGKNALAAVQYLSTRDAGKLAVGRAHYAGLTTFDGTFVDDVIVYRLAPSHFMLVVNASNVSKDYAWITEHIKHIGDVAAVDSSSRYALIAVHGPAAIEVLQPLCTTGLGDIKYYAFTYGEVAGARALVSRTGYTGEDGFEVFIPPAMADRVWLALIESGRSVDLLPCGLGARDTLRLEAGMRLYGNDIDSTTTVLEADLGWIVAWDKPSFIGQEHLRAQRDAGISRKLVGFEMIDRGIARHGYSVVRDKQPVGNVTSGTQTPYLKKSIGMAYVPINLSEPGTEILIDVRGRPSRARIVPMPFYKRARPS